MLPPFLGLELAVKITISFLSEETDMATISHHIGFPHTFVHLGSVKYACSFDGIPGLTE
jgi:hypothetical protein